MHALECEIHVQVRDNYVAMRGGWNKMVVVVTESW
jgi:hypothetical protein